MNKTEMKEKEPYEAPVVLDIKPVSTVRVVGVSPDDDVTWDDLNDG